MSADFCQRTPRRTFYVLEERKRNEKCRVVSRLKGRNEKTLYGRRRGKEKREREARGEKRVENPRGYAAREVRKKKMD